MAGIVEEQLSESEFRAKLYNTFHKKGILDSLKCQLRNLMVKELQQPSGAFGTPPTAAKGQEGSGLLSQVANSVTISHLSQNGYEYSLSTFLPEATVNESSILSSGDIIHFLRLPSDHPVATALINPNRGLLISLLEGMSSLQNFPSESNSIAVQTEDAEIQDAPKEEEEREELGVACLEGRILAIQRECESRSKRMLEFEMKRFKQKELAMMRMEEKNKCLKEVSKAKEQFEEQYKEKLALANKSQEEEWERLRRREAELEEGLFTQRQALLEEMEVLKLRENDLKKQAELNRRTAALEQEKVASLQEILTSKDNLIADIKNQYEQMVGVRVERCVAEMETKYINERQRIQQLEKELQVHQMKKADLESSHDKLSNELSEERAANRSLNQQLTEAAGRQNELLRKIESLEDKLRQASNPSVVVTSRKKEDMEGHKDNECMKHEGEVAKLEGKITKLEDTVRRLKLESASKSQEQDGLEQLIVKSNQERMALQYDNRQLHRELEMKTESCLHLQQAYDQQAIVLRSSYREIEDLQEQVEHLHKLLMDGAGGKGVRSPGREKTKVKRKRSSPAKHPLVHFSSSNNSSPLPSDASRPRPSLCGSPDPINATPFSDTSAQLLAQARATFLRLENEAKELEKSYSICKPQTTSLFSASMASSSVLPLPINLTLTGLAPPVVPTVTATGRSVLIPKQLPDLPAYSSEQPSTSTLTVLTPPHNLVSLSYQTSVTTPTQHNATPLLSTGNSFAEQSTQAVSSDHTSPQNEGSGLESPPGVGPVLLDELWKRKEDTVQTSASPSTTSFSTFHMTLGHVTTDTTTHITVNQGEKVPTSTSSPLENTKNSHKQEESGYEEWQRQQEEKRIQREEQERVDREREQLELRKMELEETMQNARGSASPRQERIDQEKEGEEKEDSISSSTKREVSEEKGEDVLAQYMRMVQQSQQTELVAEHQSDLSDKESSIMLATKSISNNSQLPASGGESTDTFEEW